MSVRNINNVDNAPLLAADASRDKIFSVEAEDAHINVSETEDVSFVSMVRLLLWKNMKSQCQRRKKSWITKILIPILFTCILALLRYAFPVEHEAIDYGDNINNPFAINSTTTSNMHWLPHTLCDASSDTPAFLIAIVPPYGTNHYIDRVIDTLNESWTRNPQQINVNQPCAAYVNTLPFQEGYLIKYFKTDHEVDQYCTTSNYGKHYNVTHDINDVVQKHRPIGFGITFEPPLQNGTQWSYRLRFNATGGPNGVPSGSGPPTFFRAQFPVPSTTQKDINLFYRRLQDQWRQGSKNYVLSTFINVQTFIDNAISQSVAGMADTRLNAITKGFFVFPTASYETDTFWSKLQQLFIFFILISFVYPFSQIVKALVEEKAFKIKEGLRMMGATFGAFWMSWYLWFWFEFLIMAFCMAFLGKWLNVFMYSHVSVILVWMVLFCTNLVTYATLISTLFDNPKIGSLVAVFMFILALIGGLFGTVLNASQQKALCVLGPSCFAMSLNNLAQYESSQIGLHWDNIHDEFQHFQFVTCLTMLCIDSVLYVLLTLYLDRVIPSKHGSRFSPFFICLPRFWCPKRMETDAAHHLDTRSSYALAQSATFETLGSKYQSLVPAVCIRDLTKHFTSFMDDNVVKAVNEISLDIFAGEVLCLLGHNGAGKTTTLSMLSGLLDISSGNAWILGHSIQSEEGRKFIRKSMGVCPQHDVLFQNLTVREHLELFCRLKGVPGHLIAREVDKSIQLIDLQDKEHEFPGNMSGGQKRKLSLGIAFIGGSKIVFLDEPTSGMDPASRRKTWNLIAKEKQNRCIILTTHFMDEADILADRIAIMSVGHIICCGSSLFLKRLYGVGYTCTIGLTINDDIDATVHCKEAIDDIVLTVISGASMIAFAGAEITYRLPFEQTGVFPKVFERLDAMKDTLSISNYGISVTTLEEVFLKIGELNEEVVFQNHYDDSLHSTPEPFEQTADTVKLTPLQDAKTEEYEQVRRKSSVLDIQEERIQQSLEKHKHDYDAMDHVFPQPTFQLKQQSEIVIFFEHFYAILYRRWCWSIRDFRALCCQILLPGYFAAVGLILLKMSQSVDNPSLALDLKQFNAPTIPYTNISHYDAHKPFAMHSEWTNTLTQWLEQENTGTIEYVPLQDDALYNVKPFQDWLLTNYNKSDEYHYNALWTSNTSNNNIQLGVNLTAVHALPIAYNLANNWVLKTLINPNASIQISSFPLVVTMNEKAISDSVSGVFASIFLMIAFAFVPVGAVYNVVMDRTQLTKHQQFVSGISFISYWIGTFVADFMSAIPAMVLVYVMVHAFEIDVYTAADAQLPFVLILVLFTLSILPFTYVLSYLFSAPDRAQTVIGTIYLMLGMILFIVSFVLSGMESTKDMNDTLCNIYRIFPTFLMADGVFAIAIKNILHPNDSYFKWDITGRNIILMLIECVGYFIIVLCIEYISASPTILQKLGFIDNFDDVEFESVDETELDDDVRNERDRMTDDDHKETVVLHGLRKVYKGPNVAVRGIYLGIPQGQVFGYLGVNGAGKTTTLSCLTGQKFKTSGNAFIHGISIENQMKCRRYIGYCPQFDALFDLLTAKQHLKFYGYLKGLRGDDLNDQIDMLLKVLSLNKYKDRRAGTYSGGNKRKLSVAISMMGNPPVVLLDEPSTGMDPLARRQMWQFIRCTMNGRCVLLTTHSMEECEALCHRLGIMVAGQLKCLGTPQHLKSKFGRGYQLDLTLKDETLKTYLFVNGELNDTFDLTLIERNQAKVTYQLLPSNTINTLAEIFGALNESQQTLPIVSYAINQTTLEQIFVRIAKQYEQ
eukprot:713449_1